MGSDDRTDAKAGAGSRHGAGRPLTARPQSLGSRSATRYRLLETLRLFALDRLDESGAATDARHTHADFYRRVPGEAAPHLIGPDEVRSQSRLEIEEPNFDIVALRWAADHDPGMALRLGVALWPYWSLRWNERRGVAYISAILDGSGLDVPEDLLAWALAAAGDMASNPGDARRSPLGNRCGRCIPTPRRRARAVARTPRSRIGARQPRRARRGGPRTGRSAGHRPPAWRRSPRGAGLRPHVPHHHRAGATLSWRPRSADQRSMPGLRSAAPTERPQHCDAAPSALLHFGRLDEAEVLCRRALEIWEHADDVPASSAHALLTLADVARLRGEHDRAIALYDDALEDLQAAGDQRCTASNYKNLATIAAASGEHDSAAGLFRRSLPGSATTSVTTPDSPSASRGWPGRPRVRPGRDSRRAASARPPCYREHTGSQASAGEADAITALLRTAPRRAR